MAQQYILAVAPFYFYKSLYSNNAHKNKLMGKIDE